MNNFVNERGFAMAEVFTELVWIAEYPEQKSVIVVDEAVFSKFSKKQQSALIKSLVVLGLEKLGKAYDNAPEGLKIHISPNKDHDNIVSGVSLLMNSSNQVEILVYFGKQADPRTTVKQSLIHVMKVLRTISEKTV